MEDWQAARLNVPCGIKTQIATIEDRLIVKTLGHLSSWDLASLDNRLRDWLGL